MFWEIVWTIVCGWPGGARVVFHAVNRQIIDQPHVLYVHFD